MVTDIATVSKAASAGVKPRAALRQVLFSQGVSEKNPPPEVYCSHDVLHCLNALADTQVLSEHTVTDTQLLCVNTYGLAQSH